MDKRGVYSYKIKKKNTYKPFFGFNLASVEVPVSAVLIPFKEGRRTFQTKHSGSIDLIMNVSKVIRELTRQFS